MNDTINFYRTVEAYGFMSNFSRHPVVLKGKIWPTSEHYFQAQKFEGTVHEENVRLTKSPTDAAAMGRDRKLPLRTDWEQVKDDIMREVVCAKFTQHRDLGQYLLNTGDAVLVEHTKNDSYWGDGGDGNGKNMLGTILMEIRKELKER